MMTAGGKWWEVAESIDKGGEARLDSKKLPLRPTFLLSLHSALCSKKHLVNICPHNLITNKCLHKNRAVLDARPTPQHECFRFRNSKKTEARDRREGEELEARRHTTRDAQSLAGALSRFRDLNLEKYSLFGRQIWLCRRGTGIKPSKRNKRKKRNQFCLIVFA